MNIYPEDYIVSVDVGFTDLNGEQITPTLVTAALYDGDDQLVVDFGEIVFEAGDTQVTISVPAQYNALAVGERSAARILRVALTTEEGVVRRSTSYLIEGEFRLAIMENSFMTVEAAELLARDMPNLSGWAAASSDARHAALIEAYRRLTRIPMRFVVADPTATVQPSSDLYNEETIILRSAWPDIDETEFLGWPLFFRRALRQAQLAEANELLEGDIITKRMRAGIISETIGESSVMIRGTHLDFGMSRAAMSYLSGHIHYDFRIARG